MLLKFIILIGITNITSLHAIAQTFSDNESDSVNVVFECLKLHAEYIEKQFVDNPSQKPVSLIVEKNDNVTNNFPQWIKPFTIQYLTRKEIIKLAKGKKNTPVNVINAPKIEGEYLTIGIIHFGVSVKGKSFTYTNEWSSSFKLKYDCKKGSYEIVNIQQGGF